MKELEKYKKRRTQFTILSLLILFAIFIYFVITVINNPEFNLNVIIAIIIFASYSILILVISALFDKYRRSLILKHFGKVSDLDMQKAKELLGQVDLIWQGNYTFLNDDQFKLNKSHLKFCLKQLSKGYKLSIQLATIFFNLQKEIENSVQKNLDINERMNAYVNEVVDVFNRNTCSI